MGKKEVQENAQHTGLRRMVEVNNGDWSVQSIAKDENTHEQSKERGMACTSWTGSLMFYEAGATYAPGSGTRIQAAIRVLRVRRVNHVQSSVNLLVHP